MCAPSPPPPPNYEAAAVAQGAANKEAAIAGSQLSNPNIVGPTGNQTVTYAPDPVTGNPIPTVTQTYSPEQQKIFDINQQGQLGLAEVGRDSVNRIGGILGQDVNFNRDLGTQSQGRQEVIDAMMSRVNQDIGRRTDNTESTLIARGIPRGSEAWNREMDTIERGRNDALQQAIVGADSRAMDDRRQAITEMMAQRQTPLNEISALRSGSQVAPLQFQNFSGQNVGAAPVFNAAQAGYNSSLDSYNAQAAGSGNMMSGLFGLGSAALMSPVGTFKAFSDIRLKSNIKRIGRHRLGIGVYEYDIFGNREIGVIAQELITVKPDAVYIHDSGFLMVDYGAI